MKTVKFLILFFSLITTFACASSKNKRFFKAIIFDMDGTTIDTDHLWKFSNAPILDSHAPHLSQTEKNEIINKFHILTSDEIWNLIKDTCSIDISIDQIKEENMKHVLIFYEKHGIKFIPYFHEFHAHAKQHNLKTAIATNSQGHIVEKITTIVPLRDHFAEHIYHIDMVNRICKPEPDIYLYAAKMLEVDPKDCIAIEDSFSGIAAAKAAGMYCIGINTGKNLLALQQADLIVDCYTQIDLEQLLTTEN